MYDPLATDVAALARDHSISYMMSSSLSILLEGADLDRQLSCSEEPIIEELKDGLVKETEIDVEVPPPLFFIGFENELCFLFSSFCESLSLSLSHFTRDFLFSALLFVFESFLDRVCSTL